jgi:hypothetical protein
MNGSAGLDTGRGLEEATNESLGERKYDTWRRGRGRGLEDTD